MLENLLHAHRIAAKLVDLLRHNMERVIESKINLATLLITRYWQCQHWDRRSTKVMGMPVVKTCPSTPAHGHARGMACIASEVRQEGAQIGTGMEMANKTINQLQSLAQIYSMLVKSIESEIFCGHRGQVWRFLMLTRRKLCA